MSDRYIIVQTGVFTDRSASAAYQIYEWEKDFNYGRYRPVLHVENSPTTMAEAIELAKERP